MITFLPPWHTWFHVPFIDFPLGCIPLIIHRISLHYCNLYPHPGPTSSKDPQVDPPAFRTGDGYGTDIRNPTSGATGSPFGRNCLPVPMELRNPEGDPAVQLVAQKLLARDTFRPAGMQLNIVAAAWIQAMVHDWIGHYDDEDRPVTLNKGAPSGCPMHSFTIKKTTERPKDGAYNSFRSHWWDASFLYGQTDEQVTSCRAYIGGKLRVNTTNPNTLPRDDVTTTGDRKDPWVGVSILQELFLKEHNVVAELIAKNHPEIAHDDEKIFGMARLTVGALIAKIHTIDWTIELLKEPVLILGMKSNWGGSHFSAPWSKFMPNLFKLIGHKKASNHGVPYSLTEEFTAVYRMHALIPDELIVHTQHDGVQVVPMMELVGESGEKILRQTPTRPMEFWDSCLRYPCGNLECHNFPSTLRVLEETDFEGRGSGNRIDMAAVDLYRDRERGVPLYNDFRQQLSLKRYKTYMEMTGGDETLSQEIAEVYGADGIDTVDLLVGCMAEWKIPGFAICETSFIIFLVMASRRLESDPFLHEYFDEAHYSATGLKWIEDTMGLRDVLARHYPDLVQDIPESMSAFTPRTPWPNSGRGRDIDDEEEKKEECPYANHNYQYPNERTPLTMV